MMVKGQILVLSRSATTSERIVSNHRWRVEVVVITPQEEDD